MTQLLYSTVDVNKKERPVDKNKPIWVFGYGSLIYKVDFEYKQSLPAMLPNWSRRFWMASQDHRGTPTSPGRVLTVIPDEHASCFGIAYQISHNVLRELDIREQNGYLRNRLMVKAFSGDVFECVVYIGDEYAPVYQPCYDLDQLAGHIFRSRGPSGENKDYVYHMADALRQFDQKDDYIFDLEARIRSLENSG